MYCGGLPRAPPLQQAGVGGPRACTRRRNTVTHTLSRETLIRHVSAGHNGDELQAAALDSHVLAHAFLQRCDLRLDRYAVDHGEGGHLLHEPGRLPVHVRVCCACTPPPPFTGHGLPDVAVVTPGVVPGSGPVGFPAALACHSSFVLPLWAVGPSACAPHAAWPRCGECSGGAT
jgi:hypothetical protein